jgi:hypothetical protein
MWHFIELTFHFRVMPCTIFYLMSPVDFLTPIQASKKLHLEISWGTLYWQWRHNDVVIKMTSSLSCRHNVSFIRFAVTNLY